MPHKSNLFQESILSHNKLQIIDMCFLPRVNK